MTPSKGRSVRAAFPQQATAKKERMMIDPSTVFVVCELARPGPEGETHTATEVQGDPRATLKAMKKAAHAHMVELRFVKLIRRDDLYRFAEEHDAKIQASVSILLDPPLEWVTLPPDYKWPWSFTSDRS
jgi:hypothetical protein